MSTYRECRPFVVPYIHAAAKLHPLARVERVPRSLQTTLRDIARAGAPPQALLAASVPLTETERWRVMCRFLVGDLVVVAGRSGVIAVDLRASDVVAIVYFQGDDHGWTQGVPAAEVERA